MRRQLKKPVNIILLIVLFCELFWLTSDVYASLTGTEGLAIDLSSAGAGLDFTIAFDPTELTGSRTWGDASTDTIVWTFNRATGTDPTITFNSGSIALQALTLITDLAIAEGGTGASTLNDLITLTTHTTGNYVASITNGAGITGGDGGSEGAGLTIAATLGTAIDTSEITDGTIAFADIDNTITLAGNPAFAASEAWFGTTGIIFEGLTPDTIEGLLTVADPTVTDKTWTLPNTTGTILLDADIGSSVQAYDATLLDIADGTIVEDLVNTANPWADNEVSDVLTIGATGLVADGAIPAGITRDAEWDTTTEINAATTDADFSVTTHNHTGTYEPADPNLTAIAALITSADTLNYWTGAGTTSLTNFTAFGRSIVDDASEAVFKATVNLEIGTDVQAYDPNLTGVAAINWTSGQFVQSSGAGNFTGVTQNAGTNITADLEEETHASEHQDTGADEIAVTAGMMNAGTGASASTFWRGDNTWATPAGSGDITDVGDATTGAAFTADGPGNNLYFEGAIADIDEIILTAADATGGDKTVTLRNATGTVLLSGDTLTGDVTATFGAGGSTATTIAADSVALTTDTTGNYVATVADGTGIDGTAGAEGATYTPILDLTEINSATFGSGTFTTLIFDAGVTDPTFTMGSDSIAITNAATFTRAGNAISDAATPFAGNVTGTIGATVVADLFILNTGDIGTGVYDFGGATSFEIPNANNPTTSVAGQIAIDNNNNFIEFYDGTASRIVPTLLTCQKTIWDPDGMQTSEDAVPLMRVEAEWAPFGITIVDIFLAADASNSTTYTLEEWTDPVTWASDIESCVFVASTEFEDDGTLADAAIAAGSYVFIDLSTQALNFLQISFTYRINEGN